MKSHNQLEIREVFHLEFLRWFGRKIKVGNYALKGGSNLRFFFNSFRYSEDMDLDVSGTRIEDLKELVMKILEAGTFQNVLKPFGVQEVIAPDTSKAKQTETTQRFKVHLITAGGEDLFTKIEFSRRGFKGNVAVEAVSDTILRKYQMPPLLIAHYDVISAIEQKIIALAARKIVQARDIFDIYILNSQFKAAAFEGASKGSLTKHDHEKFEAAQNNIYEIGYEQFRDTVLSYLSTEDQALYKLKSSWDEVKLKAAHFIDELRRIYG
jgi:predicted nucleotidyltransferase component of viral defense system